MDASHLPPPLRPFPVDALAVALGVAPDVLFAIAAGQLPPLFLATGSIGLAGSLDDCLDAIAQEAAAHAEMMAQLAAGTLRPLQRRTPPAHPERFFVYRLLDESGRIVYVGCTRHPGPRLRAHQKRWGAVIASVEMEEQPDVATMFAVEAAAIAELAPPLNIAGVA